VHTWYCVEHLRPDHLPSLLTLLLKPLYQLS